jgi:hypothetical protein
LGWIGQRVAAHYWINHAGLKIMTLFDTLLQRGIVSMQNYHPEFPGGNEQSVTGSLFADVSSIFSSKPREYGKIA